MINKRLQLMTASGWRTVAQSFEEHLEHIQENMQSAGYFQALLVHIAELHRKISLGNEELVAKHTAAFELSMALGGHAEWRVLPVWKPGMIE